MRSVLAGALALVLLSACAPAEARTEARTIAIHWSRFSPGAVTVPAGTPVAFVITNEDPIAHEWIVGSAEVHAVHRVGNEAVHEGRANEISLPAYATRTTTLTFERPGEYLFICHLPGHESYGMVGVLRVIGR